MEPLDPKRAVIDPHAPSWRRWLFSNLGERAIERAVVAFAAVAVPLLCWLLLHQ
jgi:hypothetical protein